jgi:hypothetical protein
MPEAARITGDDIDRGHDGVRHDERTPGIGGIE